MRAFGSPSAGRAGAASSAIAIAADVDGDLVVIDADRDRGRARVVEQRGGDLVGDLGDRGEQGEPQRGNGGRRQRVGDLAGSVVAERGGRHELLVNAGEVGVDLHDVIMTSSWRHCKGALTAPRVAEGYVRLHHGSLGAAARRLEDRCASPNHPERES